LPPAPGCLAEVAEDSAKVSIRRNETGHARVAAHDGGTPTDPMDRAAVRARS
jgi:hypothetical protein